MGRVQRRKRMRKNIKDIKKKHRTKRRTKDMGQIHEDMNAERLRSQEVDCGSWYGGSGPVSKRLPRLQDYIILEM